MLSTKLKEAAGNSADATLYVDDVFSTYLYTGNGSTQTITNGIDLAGKGGMVWSKDRSSTNYHSLIDTVRGTNSELSSNVASAAQSGYGGITAFNTNGYNIDSFSRWNQNTLNFVNWTFREAAKFFDVVTYTGNGVAGRTIAHSLGVAPGMIIVKKTNSTGQWCVYHRGLTSAAYTIFLNLIDSQTSDNAVWNSTAPTSSVFTVGDSTGVNNSGDTYVAYLFAHDTAADGIIQCGSFTSDGSGNVSQQTLGWQPQYILWKVINTADTWRVFDTMRDWSVSSGTKPCLRPNYEFAETNATTVKPNATGFSGSMPDADGVYIYMAIRMPNKPPTTGTQVYNAIARTGTGAAATVTGVGFPSDLVFIRNKNGALGQSAIFTDRLRGVNRFIYSGATSAEINVANVFTGLDSEDGYYLGSDSGGYGTNYNAMPFINWSFKRAPGFFDEVCYTGAGANTTVAHNLTVVPELIITKARSFATSQGWGVFYNFMSSTYDYAFLQSNGQGWSTNYGGGSRAFNSKPTSTEFITNGQNSIDASGTTYVAYLFATLAGISKVGSYTGNGTGQVIACGFSAGARFVLIKRTDSTGDWYTFDSARGLTVGSSPYLLLNSTAAEVTGNNGVYASTGGFTLGATAITTTNIASATYIFLAVA